MANGGPDANGSQFFICVADLSGRLPKTSTIFGTVTAGQDVLDAILAVPKTFGPDAARSKPVEPVIMQRVTV